MNWQIVSIVIGAIVNIVTLVGCYYGLKADNAALAARLDISLVKERATSEQANLTLKALFMEALRIVETNVKDLGQRVAMLETGQDQWTQMLRERTHDLSDEVNKLVLKVDRLERPTKGNEPSHA